jgi:hypothetical protein
VELLVLNVLKFLKPWGMSSPTDKKWLACEIQSTFELMKGTFLGFVLLS